MRACTRLGSVCVLSALALWFTACSTGTPQGTGEHDAAVEVPDASIDGGPPDAIPCNPDPDGETCNGTDDDCDGTVDENFAGVGDPCEVGVGECVNAGTTVCTADGLGTECGVEPLTPGAELCGTNHDEDCDGNTDEGFPDLGTPCHTGAGECFATGVMVCSNTGMTTTCNAVPGDTHDELCNGDDDDCDGDVDEDFHINESCDGGADSDLCHEGVWACTAGGGRVCTDDTSSTFDLCGGGDEDCDATSGDGSEDGRVGEGCDGGDGDMCIEGVRRMRHG